MTPCPALFSTRSLARSLPIWAAALFVVPTALAHTVWLEPADAEREFRVMFGGHAGVTEVYDPAKLGSVEAWDREGEALEVRRDVRQDGVWLSTDEDAALYAVHFDNGHWSRTDDGRSVNQPMDAVPGAVSGTYAIKYHKTFVEWGPVVMAAVGQPFEVTPLDAAAPKAGVPMRLLVSIDGQPAPGIAVAHDEAGREAVSDADGVVSFVPRKGFNRLWAGQRTEVDDPRHTQLSIEYMLSFTAE